MNVMTKCGQKDNVITYEHICDYTSDMMNIPPQQITLGSTCIVLNGQNSGLEIYMANSQKEWQPLTIFSGGSGGGSGQVPDIFNIINPQDGDILTYNTTTQKWINETSINFDNNSLALNAYNGQIPVADGNGNWMWGNNFVNVFNAENTYNINDYVLYQGEIYRCINPIAAPKAWDRLDWTPASIVDNVTSILNWANKMDEQYPIKNDDLLNYGEFYTPFENISGVREITIYDNKDIKIYNDGSQIGFITYYYNNAKIPDWIIPGKKYKLTFNNAGIENLAFRIYVFENGNTQSNRNIVWARNNTIFTIPINTTGITIRLQWDTGANINNIIFHPKLYLFEETSEEIINEYDYNPINIPQEIVGWQDFDVVGDEIWCILNSNANHNVQDGIIYRLNKTDFSYIGSISHNLGHFNSFNYDSDSDSIITGFHTEEDKNIYLFKNVSQWTSLTSIDYATVEKVIIDLSELEDIDLNNVCWGEKKRDGYRYIYVTSNIGKTWTKIELDVQNGQYTSNYNVKWRRNAEINTISGVNTTQVQQGIKMYNGKFYAAISHNPFFGAIYTVTNSRIAREIIHVDGTGLVEGNEGCMIINGILYLGCSSWSGASSSPVIVKIKI